MNINNSKLYGFIIFFTLFFNFIYLFGQQTVIENFDTYANYSNFISGTNAIGPYTEIASGNSSVNYKTITNTGARSGKCLIYLFNFTNSGERVGFQNNNTNIDWSGFTRLSFWLKRSNDNYSGGYHW